MLVFDIVQVLFQSGDHGMYGFTDIVFVTICACDYVDNVLGINTRGVEDG